MHCGDVVVSFKNDEDGWQRAYSKHTENADGFVPRKHQVYWRSVLFFVIKSGIQWLFGYVLTVDVYIWVCFLPLMVTTMVILMTAVLLEVMARRQPKAGGPTTYGEFNVLFKYISLYHSSWV